MSSQPKRPWDPSDNWSLRAVYEGAGRQRIPHWDEGWGPLWLVFDNVGVWGYVWGVVRARTWEEAWHCAVDEVLPGPDDDDLKEYEADAADLHKHTGEWPDLPEGWEYRGSGNPSNEAEFPRVCSGYACVSLDLPEVLRKMRKSDLEEYNLSFDWEDNES